MLKNGEDLAALESRLGEVAAAQEGYRERFGFFGRVVALFLDRRAAQGPIPRPMTGEEARVRNEGGFPLMDRGRLTPDGGAALETYDRLLSLVEEEGRLPEESIAAARELRRREDFADLLLERFRADDVKAVKPLSAEAGELVEFLVRGALRPFYENHAIAWSGLVRPEAWSEGYCPVCGGLPAMEVFEGEEGRRVLLCHRCGTTWGFQRVKCPFCGTTDQEKLRYLLIEGDPAHRVDVCDACKGYIKGADSRSLSGGLMIEAEDLITPHLDVVAVREGYVRKSPNVIGL